MRSELAKSVGVARATFKDIAEKLLGKGLEPQHVRFVEGIVPTGFDLSKLTLKEAMMLRQVHDSLDPNASAADRAKAFANVRDTIGEKPVSKSLDLTERPQNVYIGCVAARNANVVFPDGVSLPDVVRTVGERPKAIEGEVLAG